MQLVKYRDGLPDHRQSRSPIQVLNWRGIQRSYLLLVSPKAATHYYHFTLWK